MFLHNLCYLGCNSLNNQHCNWCLFYLQIHESLVLKKHAIGLAPVLKQQSNELINGKRQANRYQKLNLLFLERHN